MPDSTDILANFCTALYSKFTALTGGVHNPFYLAVGGRLYEDDDTLGNAVMPYAIYKIVSAPMEKTFTEDFVEILLQLSIVSSNSSSAEIKDAYAHASALFDECALTFTGGTLLRMHETNMVPMREEITTVAGTQWVRHYAVDYEVLIEKS